MRKHLFLIALCLVFLSYNSTAKAHESADTGTVKLLVHVDPDDVAIAGKETTIHIALHDAEHRFSLAHCHCSLYVEQDEKRFVTIPLTPATSPSVYDAEGVKVTFPSAGEYNVGVESTPLADASFAPFTVEVVEHVWPEGTDPKSVASPTESRHEETPSPTYPVHVVTLGGLLILILVYVFFRYRGVRT